MPLTFPSNPSTNQTVTQNGRVYRWSGAAWEFASISPADDARWNLFVPPAPTSVTASAGNAQAVVSWTAPTVLAQTPITDYVVQYSTNGTAWTTFSDGTSTATTATVTGLTNGTAYTFRVAAVNGVGTGAYSTASAAVSPASGDPLFGNVALLLHADGSGSTFVDSSPFGRAITASGSATQSATQSKWGGKSAYLGGGSTNYLSMANSSAFAFGADDFVIEFWLWFEQTGTQFQLFSLAGNQSGGLTPLFIEKRTTGNVAMSWSSNGSNWVTAGDGYAGGSTVLTPSAWHHVALSRASGTFRIYIDGVLDFTDSSSSAAMQTPGDGPSIGVWTKYAGSGGPFYIDDLRITKGSNRSYTGATITVPTAAYPDA